MGDLSGTNFDEEDDFTNPALVPALGQPHEDAEKKKKWIMYGVAGLAGLFILSKMFGGHGSSHAHQASGMQQPISNLNGGAHSSSGGAHAAGGAPLLGGYVAPTCPRTRVFPFHEGCPSLSHCRRRWAGVPKLDKLYGMRVAWELGSLQGLHDASTVGAVPNIELRKKFHVKPHFVRDFIRLEDELSFSVNKSLTAHKKHHTLKEVVEPSLRVALGWLCCLEWHEMKLVQKVLSSWVKKYRFRVPLIFDKISCWHDRHNAVTAMLVANEGSQKQMRRINVKMQRAIAAGGIPVLESHEMIVPYHVTLMDIRTSFNESISEYSNSIADGVDKVNKNIHFLVTLNGDPTLSPPFQIH